MAKKNRKANHSSKFEALKNPPAKPAPAAAKAAPKASKSAGSSAAAGPTLEERMTGMRSITMAGFALCGTIMGILVGLNHWVEPPATLTSPVALTAWLGAALGELRLDWSRSIMTGGLGLVVGGTLGSTLGLRPRKMLASWVLASLAMAAGLAGTHEPTVGLIGWVLGLTLALRSPVA